MTSQVQYHFHNVSIRDLLVKYTNGPMKELKRNVKEISFFVLFCLVWFSLPEFVLQESRKFWHRFHYLCKPLFINSALVLLPPKAVKVCFNLFINCSSKCQCPLHCGEIKFLTVLEFNVLTDFFGSSNTNRYIPS